MDAAAALDDEEDCEVLEKVAEHSQKVMLTFTYGGDVSKVTLESVTTHIRSLAGQYLTPDRFSHARIRASGVILACEKWSAYNYRAYKGELTCPAFTITSTGVLHANRLDSRCTSRNENRAYRLT